ncbi:hypothetical protein CPB84DRAFT_1823935, partial [Gymnopilus junonius]
MRSPIHQQNPTHFCLYRRWPKIICLLFQSVFSKVFSPSKRVQVRIQGQNQLEDLGGLIQKSSYRYSKPKPLPINLAVWARDHSQGVTVIVTIASTVLSATSRFLYARAIRWSLARMLGGPVSLYTMTSSIKIASQSPVFNAAHIEWTIGALISALAVSGHTAGWTTLLTPKIMDMDAPMSGFELDVLSPDLQQLMVTNQKVVTPDGILTANFQQWFSTAMSSSGNTMPLSARVSDQLFHEHSKGSRPMFLCTAAPESINFPFSPQVTSININYNDATNLFNSTFPSFVNGSESWNAVDAPWVGEYSTSIFLRGLVMARSTVGNNVGNTVSSFLASIPAYPSLFINILEQYIRGVMEFSVTLLRTAYTQDDNKLFPGNSSAIPPSMRIATSGICRTQAIGWYQAHDTAPLVLLAPPFVCLVSIVIILVTQIQNNHYFDPENIVHVIGASSAGGIREPFPPFNEDLTDYSQEVRIKLGAVDGDPDRLRPSLFYLQASLTSPLHEANSNMMRLKWPVPSLSSMLDDLPSLTIWTPSSMVSIQVSGSPSEFSGNHGQKPYAWPYFQLVTRVERACASFWTSYVPGTRVER